MNEGKSLVLLLDEDVKELGLENNAVKIPSDGSVLVLHESEYEIVKEPIACHSILATIRKQGDSEVGIALMYGSFSLQHMVEHGYNAVQYWAQSIAQYYLEQFGELEGDLEDGLKQVAKEAISSGVEEAQNNFTKE